MSVRRYVKLRGLVAKPQLNGTVGVVESRDDTSGRYTVRLDLYKIFVHSKDFLH